MLELRLRHWFKNLLGDDCEWREPGFGGVVGAGDAIVKLPRDGKLSVELKIWKTTTKGLCCDMRPAQIRYHFMSWRKGKGKTAIVFSLADGVVYIIDGKYVPKDKYNNDVQEKMVAVCDMNADATKSLFFRAYVKACNK